MEEYYNTSYIYTATYDDIWSCDDLGELRRIAEQQSKDIDQLQRDNTHLKQQVARLTKQNKLSIPQQIRARFSARFFARSAGSR